MKKVLKLTLDDARVMMAAAEAKSREIGVDMDIAITDDSGSLLTVSYTHLTLPTSDLV